MDFSTLGILEYTIWREEELGASQSHPMLDNHFQAEVPMIVSYAENRGCLAKKCHHAQETPADMTCNPHGDDV